MLQLYRNQLQEYAEWRKIPQLIKSICEVSTSVLAGTNQFSNPNTTVEFLVACRFDIIP